MGKWYLWTLIIILLFVVSSIDVTTSENNTASYETEFTANQGSNVKIIANKVETDVYRSTVFTFELKLVISDLGNYVKGISNLKLSTRLYSNIEQYEDNFIDNFGDVLFSPLHEALSLPSLFITTGAPSELGLYVKAEFSELLYNSDSTQNVGNWIMLDTVNVNKYPSPPILDWIIPILIIVTIIVIVWRVNYYRKKSSHQPRVTTRNTETSVDLSETENPPVIAVNPPQKTRITRRNTETSVELSETENPPVIAVNSPQKPLTAKIKTFNCRSCGSSPNVGDTYCYECGTKLI